MASSLAAVLVCSDAWKWISLLLTAIQAAFTLAATPSHLSPTARSPRTPSPVPSPGPLGVSPAETENPPLAQMGGLISTQGLVMESAGRGAHQARIDLPLAAALSLSLALLLQLTGLPIKSAAQATTAPSQVVALLLPAALAALSSAEAAENGFRRAALREVVPSLVVASASLGGEGLSKTLQAIWTACRCGSDLGSGLESFITRACMHFNIIVMSLSIARMSSL